MPLAGRQNHGEGRGYIGSNVTGDAHGNALPEKEAVTVPDDGLKLRRPRSSESRPA